MSGAARYELWSWTSASGWQQIGGDDLTATSYRHDNLTAGVTYYYHVRAVDASGATGPWSERVSATVPGGLTATPTTTATPAPPAIPGNFAGTVTDDDIVLSWTAPEGSATNYNIYRTSPRHSKHGTAVVYLALGSSRSYTDRDIAVAGHYRYQIQAARGSLASDWSDTLTVVVPESAFPTATGTPVQSTATPTLATTPASTPIRLPTATPTATPALTLSCANSEAIPDPEPPALVADCETLLGLKEELAGDATLNWSLSRPISDWQGVSASNINERVSVLFLEELELTGSIPAALGSLPKLRVLHLQDNQLSGAIPSALGSLTDLKRLHLQNNELTSTIPAALDDLVPPTGKLLDVKIATGNSLCGPIPPALHAFIPAGSGESDLNIYDYPSGTLGDCSSSSPPSTATLTATLAATPTATPASALTVPTLTAQAGADAVELRWTEVSGAVRYELMVWWDVGTGWQSIEGANLTGTSYTHTDVAPGTTYYYSIRAVNAAGETSEWLLQYASATAAPPR